MLVLITTESFHSSMTDGVEFELNGAKLGNVRLCLNERDDIKLEQSDYPIPDFGIRKGNGDIIPLGMILELAIYLRQL